MMEDAAAFLGLMALVWVICTLSSCDHDDDRPHTIREWRDR
jgi:hypothetical protein